MSTRSKTRAALASTSQVSPPDPPKPQSTARTRPRKPSQTTVHATDAPLEKQDEGPTVPQPPSKPQPPKNKKSKAPIKAVYCLCAKGDDGTPMVHCSECKEWYHFSCINLDEIDASDLSIYICGSCTETTAAKHVMGWPEALEECVPNASAGVRTASKEPTPKLQLKPPPAPSLNRKMTRRRVRRPSYHSESESSDADGGRVSRRRVGASPGLSTQLKRKTSHASQLPPPSKRKKPSDVKATDDPARKYCLGKLEEVFRDIFLRYPHVRGKRDTAEGGGDEENIIQKPLQELTEDEKGALLEEAKQFAMDLEQCVYDIYSEPDKQGMPSAGGKYKDRFRMLQFNLSKVDRIVIHQRIASANITPKEISLMSSTDLANEETKESIKIAEKEALEHSILQKATAPRAKITHKGLQDIEDVNGEPEREQEEEEKRERERMARLRTLHSQQRQRTASISVPPESPIGQQNTAWGGPPPVPMHAMPPGSEVPSSPGSERPAMYLHGSSDFTNMEPELNLADLINIDDEPGGHENNTPVSPSLLDAAAQAPMAGDNPTPQPLSPGLPLVSPTGISPFAAQTGTPQTPSFNLDSLWKAPKPEPAAPTSESSPAPGDLTTPPATDTQKDVIMETEVIEEADDHDFDMLLEEKEQDTPMAATASQSNFEASPQVWTGKLGMPLDSTTPQETPVIARQMGGRSIAPDSALWKTLFPTSLLKIEGRVPVKDSAKFLLQVRMNPTKELIGVAFSSESNNVGFTLLMDFLIAKDRHGLVFPWGPRPKEHYPGREFYVIPLLSSDPLPDYMELLDELKLPKTRTLNYLVGIWVLNKGKLAAPPVLAPSAPVPNPPVPQANIPLRVPPPGQAPVAPPQTAAILAEMATLTPEQLQLVLSTLSSVAINPIPGISLPPSTAVAPPPPPHLPNPTPPPPPGPPPGSQQAWQPNPISGYPGGYPPPGAPDSRQQPAPPYGQSPEHYGYERGAPGHPRGDRGRDRGRGRGRGRDRGRDGGDGSRPADTGWPRKSRSDVRGGGPASPNSQRWEERWK
ncbi:hypothetical protein BD779DRAFT_1511945 [Infundibulicybe gibba]|nr:hypothetical protein BD779DRAFT_1511945 [Infundibulicybe gibba]